MVMASPSNTGIRSPLKLSMISYLFSDLMYSNRPYLSVRMLSSFVAAGPHGWEGCVGG